MAVDKLAKGLASLGRNGDSVLVHMHPAEVAGLQALAESRGTTLTINPHTGMPEAFSLTNFLTSLLPTAVGIALAPETGGASLGLTAGSAAASAAASAAPIIGGALTGAALAGAKGENPLLGGLTGGLGGYGGSGLAGNVAKLGATAASQPGPVAAIPNALASEVSAPLPPAASDIPFRAVTDQGTTNFYGGATDLAAAQTPQQNFMAGLEQIKENPMDFLSQNKMAVGMPLGMAALSGLEPSDLYPDLKANSKDKYDPYATLNLSGDSGLRLFAEGGMTSGGLSSLYSNPDGTIAQNTLNEGYGAARLDNLAKSYNPGFAHGGYLDGPGDGMSDSIPATIEGKQPARLADAEFVLPADIVSHIGNGSSKAGAKRLYAMMDRIRTARTGTKKQGKQIDPNKFLPA